MKKYQTITKNNSIDFDIAVNEVVQRHRKESPRLEHFQMVISTGFTTYYSGVISWGKEKNEVTFELDQNAPDSD